MRDLIDDVFVGSFDNAVLDPLEDQARLPGGPGGARRPARLHHRLLRRRSLVLPGGDIGTLAVYGTVNDLAVSGARPLYLSCSVILEEGLSVETLRRVAQSMAEAARAANVAIVTGDTKVVEAAPPTSSSSTPPASASFPKTSISPPSARGPGDVVIVNGTIGDHGAAILCARQDLALSTTIESDCQPLYGLIRAMLEVCPDIHCLRDATRGGVATVLNEFAQAASVCIRFDETSIPVCEAVKGVCEILGLDPLYLANEGKLVAVVPRESADAVLGAMRMHSAGRDSAIIGEVTAEPEAVVLLRTVFGGERIVDMLVGEQLPRIC